MKRVCLIAAGVIAFGTTAARAADDVTETTVVPADAPDQTTTGVPGSPDTTSPSTGVPGSVETAPGTNPPPLPSGGGTSPPPAVDVENPPLKPPPVAQPVQREVMPRPVPITANVAAQTGAVTEPSIPMPPLGVPSRTTNYDHYPVQGTWVGRLGAGLLVGGGVEDFTDSSVRSVTGVGGSWMARAIAGTRQLVGVEAAYVGGAHGLDMLGVGTNAMLVSNGVEGAVRVNIPVLLPRTQLLEPFGFVGLGWSHYSVTNTNVTTADINRNDDIMALPIGGGLEYAIGRFMADARFTYRSTYYNDLMRTGGNLNNWGVSGQVGFSF